MKTELSSAILAAVAGVVIAFLVCNLFIGDIKPVDVQVVSGEVGADYAEPNPEVFNYKALNPTVEVYVGNGQTVEYTYQVPEDEEENENSNDDENENDNNTDNNNRNSDDNNSSDNTNRRNS